MMKETGPEDHHRDQRTDEHRPKDGPRTPVPHTVSPDDSPVTVISSTLSVTPRNIYAQPGLSLTPTRTRQNHGTEHMSLFHDEQEYGHMEHEEQAWGDDAVLRWEGVDSVNSEDDISSVAPDEAGVSDDDEENWGRDAIIDFTYSSQEKEVEPGVEQEVEIREEEDEAVEQVEIGQALNDAWGQATPGVVEETQEQLIARGMPDYQSWDDTKLQVSQRTPPLYGCLSLRAALDGEIRLSTHHKALGSCEDRHRMLESHPSLTYRHHICSLR